MKFAKYSFYIAGVYGLLAIVPQYFLEEKNGLDYPPAITHPEYYYGFIGVTLAFQLVFLVIGSDPRRYRALMPPSMVEKFSFVIAAYVLYAQDRIPTMMVAAATIDLVLGVLFIVSYFKVSDSKFQIPN